MATYYSGIYDVFKSKIEDKDLVLLSEEDQQTMMGMWLDSAISYIELDCVQVQHDLTKRDSDIEMFEDDLTSGEKELIALYMIVAWYDQRINSLTHTLMYFATKDEKWTSQKDHLNMMQSTRDNYRRLAKSYFLNHSSKKNSYLGNV